jgi:AcrR family transcriptional regulator
MTKSPAPEPLSTKRSRTRTRLLDAAAKLFAGRGLYGATLQEVATRANMTTGVIYGDFRNKQELFVAIFERFTFGVNARLREDASFEGKRIREQMQQIGESVIAFFAYRQSRRRAVL